MFNYFRKELDWGGRKLILETGKMARQADGAVLARYGDTIVLCTAVGVKSSRPGQDFFPLTLSAIPFFGPVGAARVGYKNGQYILNPTADQMDDTELELVVAGTAEGVLMVESEAKELSEDVMLGAVNFGHASFHP